MVNYALMLLGNSGSGKGTFFRHVLADLGYTQISSGDLVRYELDNKTELGQELKHTTGGDHAKDDIIETIVANEIQRVLDQNEHAHIAFDGVPRNLSQIEMITHLKEGFDLEGQGGIYIDTPEDECRRRLSGRYNCDTCGKDYNANLNTLPLDMRCAIASCKGPVNQREDDTPEGIENRLSLFKNEVLLAVEYLKANERVLTTIDGMLDIEEQKLLAYEALSNFKGINIPEHVLN